uniref:Uncharacterized protein n=1 Tax=Rhizophora mucronata TaxID=61149 RepID=A0A2P2IM69_RHIMU
MMGKAHMILVFAFDLNLSHHTYSAVAGHDLLADC